MTRPVPRKRGRPRAYDRDVALSKARDTFWHSGFAATSLDDLTAQMKMNRPSIYAAFGDKRALYQIVAAQYGDTSRAWLTAALDGDRPLRGQLLALYREALDFYLAGRPAPRGCFLIGTAVTEAANDDEVRTIVEDTMTAFTAAFATRFERAEHDGEIASLAPGALAHIATAALNALAVRARAGARRRDLTALIDATVDAICGPPARPCGSPT